MRHINEVMWVKYEEPTFPWEEDDDEYEDKLRKYSNTNTPMLVGPMGIIPINERNIPGKSYNFWILHTNFDITDKEVEILDKLKGIETLDIFTRYRCRIGIGKVFDEEDVKADVEKHLGVIK